MTTKPIPSLSVVMPAYNEQDVLPITLAEAVAALDEIAEDWELLMVDDGSKDRTPQILAEWAEKDPRIKVLTQNPNQGYARALIRGFHAATRSAVFYTDADAQFDLCELTLLYPDLGEFDLVAGYRVGRKDPAIRFVTSFVYNTLQTLVLGTWARDVNCAFKLFRRSFFDVVELDSDGFVIDAEIYIRAKKAGLKWTQHGVTHRPRTMGSTTVKFSTVVETLKQLMALRRAVTSSDSLHFRDTRNA